MKKTLPLILLGILFLPLCASAQLTTFGPSYSLSGMVSGILNAVWIVFTAIAVVMFVAAGVLFLTAQGEPAKLQIARHAFLWGVVGVIVGIIAYGIIGLIERIL